MPRGFSKGERKELHARLLAEGRALFERYGLGRTTVEELARAVGIAKGSFYRFFDSKEALYMEILEQEEERQKHAVLERAGNANGARSAFVEVIRELLTYARSDSLVTKLRESGDYALLSRALGQERLARHFEQDEETVKELLTLIEKKGVRLDVNTRVFAGLLRGIAMMVLHDEEIGRDIAEDAVELLVGYVADGLFGKGTEDD